MTTAFPARTLQEIHEGILRDIRGQRPEAPLAANDDEVIRSRAVSAAIEGAYLHQKWILRQLFPQTAEDEYLDLHADQKAGIKRKKATTASGTMLATGTPGAAIPAGTQATRDGLLWTTTAAAELDGAGTATVAAQAESAGSSGNLEPGTLLTWVASPPGVLSEVAIDLMGGGTDDEVDNELRARLLFALRNPEGAGSKADYLRWATSVEGVTSAYVYPKRRGLGSVDVAITSGGGLPSPEVIAAAQADIESRCPAEADVLVFAPTLVDVDMTIQVAFAGMTLVQAQARVQDVVTAYFSALAPGATVVLKQIEAQIMAIDGISDCAITAPAGNVTATISFAVVEWLRKGVVTVSALP